MKKILFAAAAAPFFAGCFKGNDNKCTYNECASLAPPAEIQEVQTYLSSRGIAATQHCSGIFYVLDNAGSGTKPNGCDVVTVNYKGQLTNGNTFDSTEAGKPASFDLDGVVTGFRNGLMQVRSGGRVRLFIPPSLGYGNRAQGSIPANSVLIFTVDLLNVQ